MSFGGASYFEKGCINHHRVVDTTTTTTTTTTTNTTNTTTNTNTTALQDTPEQGNDNIRRIMMTKSNNSSRSRRCCHHTSPHPHHPHPHPHRVYYSSNISWKWSFTTFYVISIMALLMVPSPSSATTTTATTAATATAGATASSASSSASSFSNFIENKLSGETMRKEESRPQPPPPQQQQQQQPQRPAQQQRRTTTDDHVHLPTASVVVDTASSPSPSTSNNNNNHNNNNNIDVIAILPDRSTAYANGVHNGLILSSRKLNISLEIQDFGNYNQELSYQVLQHAIDTPSEQQPRVYIVWPIDLQSKRLIQTLYQTHNHDDDHDDHDENENENENDGIRILQINQIPGVDTQWEWDHLLGYAGQSDAVRASNAGAMMVQAMTERDIHDPVVVALGYPITYGGFDLAAAAFRQALTDAESDIQLVETLPLQWGSQNAYDQMVLMLDALIEQGIPLHGVYAMDDDILLGAYQAIADRRHHHQELLSISTSSTTSSKKEDKVSLVHDHVHGDEDDEDDDDTSALDWLDEITLVGTGCNGARSLLQDGAQYGTTVQSPYLEAILAMDSVHQFLQTGSLPQNQTIRFTPSPIITGDTMNSLLVPFFDDLYVADELCTWNLHHSPLEGLLDPTLPRNICDWSDCLFVPESLYYAGYTMVGMNYTLALFCAIVIVLYRQERVMTLAQPPFLLLVILGVCIDTTSLIFMSRDNHVHGGVHGIDLSSTKQAELDASCFAWPWLLTLGQMMTTATLVAKIYRVKVVTNGGSGGPGRGRGPASGGGRGGGRGVAGTSKYNKRFRRVTVTAQDVSYFIFGGLLLDLIILLVWFQTDPFYWQIQVVQTDARGHILSARGGCASDGEYSWLYPGAIVLLHSALLIYANVLAYQTRFYHAISDSHMVAISLFNSIQLLLVATLMSALSGHNVSIAYLVRSSYAFLTNVGVLSLVVVPKVYQCLLGKEPSPGGNTIISGLHPPLCSGSPHGSLDRPRSNSYDNESNAFGGVGGSESCHMVPPQSANGDTNGSSSLALSTSVVSFESPPGPNSKTSPSELLEIKEEEMEYHTSLSSWENADANATTSPSSSTVEICTGEVLTKNSVNLPQE